MASSARIDELKKKFDENPRRYFAPLANEFRKAGDAEQAIIICEEFLPQQPGHMSGHIVYGQALYESGRIEDSKTVFETALTLDPENLIALRHLGDIARSQGDMESARRWYDRVLEADPRNDEIQGLIASLPDAAPSFEPPAAPAPVDFQSFVPPAAEPAPSSAPEQRFAPPATREPPRAPEPVAPLDLDLDDELVMPGSAPATAQPSAAPARAEGLEAMEFAAPQGDVGGTLPDLDIGLETTAFAPPAGAVAPLEGLEETALAEVPPTRGESETMPALELDEGPGISTSGVPMAGLEQSRTLEFSLRHPDAAPVPEPPPALEDLPALEEPGTIDAAAAVQGIPLLEPMDVSMPPAAPSQPGADLPVELPPAVIAAEAELIDDIVLSLPAPSAPAPAAPAPAPAAPAPAPAPLPELELPEPAVRRPTPAAPFVTETMAELYVKQGFRDQALDVYRQLLAANPGSERLRARVEELSAPAAAPAEDAGPTVRDFLSRIAARRPGEQGLASAPPSSDDFAAFDLPEAAPEPAWVESVPTMPAPPEAAVAAAPAPQPERMTTPPMPSPVERGAEAQGGNPGGSIDALFGSRPVGSSEDSAASALAQAFGSAQEPIPVITGRPARAASQELSLDSVFRDGSARPPRPSQSFSFDQFFSEASSAERPAGGAPQAPDAAPHAEPAERSSEDIEQFNSWLQGLKQK